MSTGITSNLKYRWVRIMRAKPIVSIRKIPAMLVTEWYQPPIGSLRLQVTILGLTIAAGKQLILNSLSIKLSAKFLVNV
jgi:hypothetical protein